MKAKHWKEIQIGCVLSALMLVLLAEGLRAQGTSTTRTQSGQPTMTTEVRKGEVVYVSGNDLVVKMADGQVRHFAVPAGSVFRVDGRDLSVAQLTPGMQLTQTITTTTTPHNVQTVRTVSGTVWNAFPPKTVILTLPDGTNKQYTVPEGTKFTVGGQEKTVFDLTKGMRISATVVTTAPEVLTTSTSTVTGRTPLPPPQLPTPQALRQTSALLVEESAAPPTQAAARPASPPAQAAPPAPSQQTVAARQLPATASRMPLIALFGAMAVIFSMVLAVIRNTTSPS